MGVKRRSPSPKKKRVRTAIVPAHSQRRVRGDDVVERLRRSILLGKFAPGTRLMPERELAEKMKTNRNTLREALRVLERERLIRSRQGDGTMVLDWRAEGELGLLPMFLREDTPPEERFAALISLLALRDQVLGFGVQRAAMVHVEADLDRVAQVVASMRDPSASATDLIQRDIEFYRTLVHSAHDLVLTWTFNTFAKVFTQLGEMFPLMWPIDEVYLSGIDELIACMRRRDPAAAAKQLVSILQERSAAVAQRIPYP